MMALSSPNLPYSDFFQPVLSGATESNVKSLEVIPLSSYTLGRWEKIFQVLEAQSQKTPMMLSEGIRRSKGGVVKITNIAVNFTEPDPE